MDEQEFEKLLSEKLKRLGQNDEKTPELAEFAALVKQEKQKIARRQNIQFTVFLSTSVFILAALFLSYFRNQALFFSIQAIPVVILAIFGMRRTANKTYR